MIIRVIAQDQTRDLPAEAGTTLMAFLRRHGLAVEAPCGGRGTCGKCLVSVDGLGPVLACQTVIGRDLPLSPPGADANPDGADARPQSIVVWLPRKAKALILIDGIMRDQTLDPLVRHFEAVVPPATLDSQLADDERFLQATGYSVPFPLLADLAALLAGTTGLVRYAGRTDTRTVLRFLPAEPAAASWGFARPLGMALDIGTTTLAAYLYSLHDGRRLASTAMGNPQAAFGADVISRIARASASRADALELRQVLLTAITRMADSLVEQANGQESQAFLREDLALLSLAGNTTMLHLLAGLPAASIACTPFNPVTVRSWILPAPALALDAFPGALAILLPSVAGYVGADITAGVIALGLEKPVQGPTLLIDIGTNGEIVLKAGDRLAACSTAAGPAFEGASISSGMSGTGGAIDHVWLDRDDIRFTIIDGQPDEAGSGTGTSAGPGQPASAERPAGICGSGLVDAVAVMLDSGVIDETGRIGADPDRLPPALRSRLAESGGQPAFRLAGADETNHGRPVLLTQKDIRELQNAKAAIAAGISLLLRSEGVAPGDVHTVYLAGGFGQYLNVRSAQAIGLLPPGLGGRVVAAGNTSAMGAIAALLNRSMIGEAQAAAQRMAYRELSADPAFSDLFIDALLFPESD